MQYTEEHWLHALSVVRILDAWLLAATSTSRECCAVYCIVLDQVKINTQSTVSTEGTPRSYYCEAGKSQLEFLLVGDQPSVVNSSKEPKMNIRRNFRKLGMRKQMHTTVLENNLIVFAVEEDVQVSLPGISLGG